MWTRVWLASVSYCLQLAISSALLAPYARAQEPPDPAHYQMLIDEGIREYGLHNFAEARSLLTRAQLHFPNARALRAIGMAEFELGNYAASASALAAALASERRPLDGAQRSETEQLLARAENFLTHVCVFGRPWPSVVQVDGVQVPLPPGGELVLEVGEHELTFARPGHLEERRRIRAVGNEWLSIQVSLLPLIVTPFAERSVSPFVVPLQRELPASPRQRWIWSSVLLVSAALAAGLGFGLSARQAVERAPIAANPIAIRRGP
jgi:tetratricopeptide (TPR) repeat protein